MIEFSLDLLVLFSLWLTLQSCFVVLLACFWCMHLKMHSMFEFMLVCELFTSFFIALMFHSMAREILGHCVLHHDDLWAKDLEHDAYVLETTVGLSMYIECLCFVDGTIIHCHCLDKPLSTLVIHLLVLTYLGILWAFFGIILHGA